MSINDTNFATEITNLKARVSMLEASIIVIQKRLDEVLKVLGNTSFRDDKR